MFGIGGGILYPAFSADFEHREWGEGSPGFQRGVENVIVAPLVFGYDSGHRTKGQL
ncbi:hypothetical protein BAC2_03892 [uncultured bacterium]|nr:hypothetical protein BAC2_03892 [uncultured bacterium]